MKVVKKINNNIALCIDNNERELIAIGTGIGFPSCPYELRDLNKIQRTFYHFDESMFALLHELPTEILDTAASIVDIASTKLSCEMSPNITFTLADHIHFAIERVQKHMIIQTPLYRDIQYLYEIEFAIGEMAVKMIQERLHVKLPKGEAGNIAMHFVNAESNTSLSNQIANGNEIIRDITEIIAATFHLHIDRSSFHYARFTSHMMYLLKRQKTNDRSVTDYREMFDFVKNQYPQTYICLHNIQKYLQEQSNWTLSEEESLYLMLHINRLCTREDGSINTQQ